MNGHLFNRPWLSVLISRIGLSIVSNFPVLNFTEFIQRVFILTAALPYFIHILTCWHGICDSYPRLPDYRFIWRLCSVSELLYTDHRIIGYCQLFWCITCNEEEDDSNSVPTTYNKSISTHLWSLWRCCENSCIVIRLQKTPKMSARS